MRPVTATTEVSAPTVSKECPACSRESGTERSVRASATPTSATGRTNSHRQLATSTSSAERNIPMTPPPPATPVQTPIAFPRSASGKVEVITARVIGMIIAAPTPLRTRAASMIPAVGASPASTLATPKTIRPAISIGFRPIRSPIAPSGSRSAARARV